MSESARRARNRRAEAAELRELRNEVLASRKLIADLRALHRPMWVSAQAKAAGKQPWVCELCGTADGSWPCESVLLIDEAGL